MTNALIPVLWKETEPENNPWNVSFKQGLFNMTSESDRFHSLTELERNGYSLSGNQYILSKTNEHKSTTLLPLYEAKMMHLFTHRWATYVDGVTREVSPSELQNSNVLVVPRYWVEKHYVTEKAGDSQYFFCFRDITRKTDERTTIACIVPLAAISHKLPIIAPDLASSPRDSLEHTEDNMLIERTISLYANICAFAFDYVSRQKTGGVSLGFFIFKQLPVIPPHTYTQALLDFIVPRVLELSYTAWDLQAFAQDVGWDGPPFIWDEERRFLMRCELDALYFHLYQISREDVDYIMDTFPIVKRKDIKRTEDENGEGGEYITKNVILEMYDQMAGLPRMDVPAPKDPDATYPVPDVSQWRTWLNPLPAHPSVAHEDDRE